MAAKDVVFGTEARAPMVEGDEPARPTPDGDPLPALP